MRLWLEIPCIGISIVEDWWGLEKVGLYLGFGSLLFQGPLVVKRFLESSPQNSIPEVNSRFAQVSSYFAPNHRLPSRLRYVLICWYSKLNGDNIEVGNSSVSIKSSFCLLYIRSWGFILPYPNYSNSFILNNTYTLKSEMLTLPLRINSPHFKTSASQNFTYVSHSDLKCRHYINSLLDRTQRWLLPPPESPADWYYPFSGLEQVPLWIITAFQLPVSLYALSVRHGVRRRVSRVGKDSHWSIEVLLSLSVTLLLSLKSFDHLLKE